MLGRIGNQKLFKVVQKLVFAGIVDLLRHEESKSSK